MRRERGESVNKMQNIIMVLAALIFLLSIYLIGSVFTSQANPINSTISNNIPPINNEGQTKPGEPNKDLEELLTGAITQKNNNLSNEEVDKIIKTRSPFSASPIVDKDFKEVEKIYQEKLRIQKEKIEKEDAIKKLTEVMGKAPTEKQVKDYLENNIIPSTDINVPVPTETNIENPLLKTEPTTQIGNTLNNPQIEEPTL